MKLRDICFIGEANAFFLRMKTCRIFLRNQSEIMAMRSIKVVD